MLNWRGGPASSQWSPKRLRREANADSEGIRSTARRRDEVTALISRWDTEPPKKILAAENPIITHARPVAPIACCGTSKDPARTWIACLRTRNVRPLNF